MIIKDGNDRYIIDTLGESTQLVLTERELLTRLRARGIWSEEQLAQLVAQAVGYETIMPYAKYV